MLIKNQSTNRCLVCLNDNKLKRMLQHILDGSNFHTDYVNDRKNALKYFLQYKPCLLCIDADFLPRFPFRLVQLFKIAHRMPGVLIFNTSYNNLAGYACLKNNFIKVVDAPFTDNAIESTLRRIVDSLTICTINDFSKNLLLLLGIAAPVLLFTVYCIISSFFK
jgi:DNA-binding NtrC family response regulator